MNLCNLKFDTEAIQDHMVRARRLELSFHCCHTKLYGPDSWSVDPALDHFPEFAVSP